MSTVRNSANRAIGCAFVVVILTLTLGSITMLLLRVTALPGVARAQGDVMSDLLNGTQVDQLDGAALRQLNPPDLDALPGVHNRARRQPPPLLTEAEVEAGLGTRLARMHEKQAARTRRKSQPRRGGQADDTNGPPFDHDPPRQPEPPPPPESLEH